MKCGIAILGLGLLLSIGCDEFDSQSSKGRGAAKTPSGAAPPPPPPVTLDAPKTEPEPKPAEKPPEEKPAEEKPKPEEVLPDISSLADFPTQTFDAKTPDGQSMANLRAIVIAWHLFHKKNNTFPPTTIGEHGDARLSWRVALLPYLGQKELFKQFNLKEPWNSPANLKLAAKIPAVFRTPGLSDADAAQGKTCYLATVGPGTIAGLTESLPLGKIVDKPANTLLLVEANADRAVVWTQPDDLRYIPAVPLAGLGTLRGKSFLAAFADGTVRAIPNDAPERSLRAIFTATGQERDVLPFDPLSTKPAGQ